MSGEGEPPLERGPGKFRNNRDACLHLLSVQGWSNESNGDVSSPQGFFSKIAIEEAELGEIVEAFQEELDAEGLVDKSWLLGNHLLLEDDLGFVTVNDYESREELDHEFLILEEAFNAWLEAQEPEGEQ